MYCQGRRWIFWLGGVQLWYHPLPPSLFPSLLPLPFPSPSHSYLLPTPTSFPFSLPPSPSLSFPFPLLSLPFPSLPHESHSLPFRPLFSPFRSPPFHGGLGQSPQVLGVQGCHFRNFFENNIKIWCNLMHFGM
jgi:hypothetical protein